MTESYSAKSPTRIDLAGGTLDFWPLYMFIGGASTVNVAIDIFTECTVRAREDREIHLTSLDQKLSERFGDLSEFLETAGENWSLFKEHLSYWRPRGGVEVVTNSGSPAGGGLGGSSSLSISLLRAFERLMDRRLNDLDKIQVAGNLEAKVLHTPTGCQDYYPAVFGGVNFITLNADGVSIETIAPPQSGLEEHFFIVYTGHPHHSGMNNWSIIKRAVEKDPQVLKALHRLKEVAAAVEMVCRNSSWGSLGELLDEEYKARIQLAPEVLCDEILRLKELSDQVGADALKICGAGGGGCVIVWCAPTKIEAVKQACRSAGFEILLARPVAPIESSHGSNQWN